MEIEIQITRKPIAKKISASEIPHGALVEFRGVVRGEEDGKKISALGYEAYSPMAENEMHRILETLAKKFPCLGAKIIHRTGTVPVGETAIYVGIVAKHRAEAIALLAEFMDRLKQDVPVWKRRAVETSEVENSAVTIQQPSAISCDEAVSKINSHCQTLPGVRVSLDECSSKILREDIFAPEDFPATDKSTRDGYAILQNDSSANFQVVDTIHAADWKPRELKSGEAVRVATGASLPCENLRVVMQENVERDGAKIKILCPENSANVRLRGEEMRAGDPVLASGKKLNPGALALLATVGCTQPLVSSRLRVLHFTTGDEIISPGQKPQPGQIRDSNSILIRALLEKFQCEVTQKHLPENFDAAKQVIENFDVQLSAFNLILVSGGASVGDLDFTRPLLEWLGFEIVFSRVNIRPGAPLIFGTDGGANRVAFGLPGNPVSHFVCFQLFVAAAIAKLTGAEMPKFSGGTLAAKLDDTPNPRETLWPARGEWRGSGMKLTPLNWSSSGDVKSLAETDALIRVPPRQGSLAAGARVEFLPANF